MKRPLLLDLFCCAGGAATGYHRAGFDVLGVDIKPQPNYPFPLIQGDALVIGRALLQTGRVDAVHASPPCQRYSRITAKTDVHPDLIPPTRVMLQAWGGPYVIENVIGAPLLEPFQLCGTSFGLGAACKDGIWRPLARHRLFETNTPPVLVPQCRCRRDVQAVGVYGHGGGKASRHGYSADAAEAREAMGIDWMRHYEVVEALPPSYTEWIGEQLLGVLSQETVDGEAMSDVA